MVSFSCEACGDVLTKKKLDPHRNRCQGATFTCIDCMVHFPGFEYRSHTSCMTEDQKYQGALYKPKQNKQQHQQQQPKTPKPAMPSQQRHDMATLALQPYVEDIGEDKEYQWHDFETYSDDETSPAAPLPEAPTPPSAANDDHVNVFDFLVAAGQTPNASKLNLPRDQPSPSAEAEVGDSTSLVRYEPKKEDEEELLGPSLMDQDGGLLAQYGTGPITAKDLATPAPKTERRRSKDGELKKDKKRKRLHVDVTMDQIMADAPPVLHSGLTGGLKSLMRPAFPPSPDYSGDNIAEVSPASPLKKTKHSKHHKSHQVSNSIFGMINGPPLKSKSKKPKTSKKHSHRHHEKKEQKLLGYRPDSKDGEHGNIDSQMIVFKPRADVFLSFVNKGPESDRGCSMNKALKRFHRERQAAGSSAPKGKEEKELWRSLRLRRNDRGEIVLFSE